MLYTMRMKLFFAFLLLMFPVSLFAQQEITLQDKIDQMIIVGFRGTTYERAPEIQQLLSETNIGGVILFDYDTPTKKFNRNIASRAQLTKLIADLQKNAQTPLFISIDEEGGRVSRLKSMKGYQNIPTAQVLGTYSIKKVSQIASSLARTLSSLGVMMNFAPVLDIDTGKQNPIIGKFGRAFGTSPQHVSLYGRIFAREMERSGVLAVGKHFPGHGSALSDSHKEFTDITEVWSEDDSSHLLMRVKQGFQGLW